MTPDVKEKLLERKFTSLEYMQEFAGHFHGFIKAGFEAVDAYKKNPPDAVNIDSKALKDQQGDLYLWDLKVLPNFRFMNENMKEAIANARLGKTSTIRSAAGNLRGLGKSMDGIREAFMDAIDPEIKDRYFQQLKLARKKGNNIYYTLSGWWDPGELLDEEITGPIDEQDLLRYLKPGESI